jgi:hypothetical protein
MTIELAIKPELESRLAERAAASGLSPRVYLEQAVDSVLSADSYEQRRDPQEEFATFLNRLVFRDGSSVPVTAGNFDREWLYSDDEDASTH